MKKQVFGVLLLCLVCASCATLPVLPPESPSAKDLLQQINARTASIRGFKGLARIQVVTSDKHFGSHEVLLAQRPAFLRMEILGPLGTPQFFLVTDGRELKVYNPAENRFYAGPASAEHLSQMIPFMPLALTPDEVVSFLLGGVPTKDWTSVSVGRDEKDALWVMDLSSPSLNERQRLWIEPRSFSVVRAEFHRPRLSAVLAFSDFQKVNGISFPQKIQFTSAEPKVQISINYGDMDLNPSLPADNFQLPVPRGATVTPLE